MDFEKCIVHTPTEQEYYDVLKKLYDKKIFSEKEYEEWKSAGYYLVYKKEMSLYINPGCRSVTYSSLKYHTTTPPYCYYPVYTAEEILTPEEPFTKTISMEDIYKSIKTEPNT